MQTLQMVLPTVFSDLANKDYSSHNNEQTSKQKKKSNWSDCRSVIDGSFIKKAKGETLKN